MVGAVEAPNHKKSNKVRDGRIGHELLRFLFRFTHKNLSTRDPASAASHARHACDLRFSTRAKQFARSSPQSIQNKPAQGWFILFDAGWENRTPAQSLENSYSTVKLIPRVQMYKKAYHKSPTPHKSPATGGTFVYMFGG